MAVAFGGITDFLNAMRGKETSLKSFTMWCDIAEMSRTVEICINSPINGFVKMSHNSLIHCEIEQCNCYRPSLSRTHADELKKKYSENILEGRPWICFKEKWVGQHLYSVWKPKIIGNLESVFFYDKIKWRLLQNSGEKHAYIILPEFEFL